MTIFFQMSESDISEPEWWNDSDIDDETSIVHTEVNDASNMVTVLVLFILTWQTVFRIANMAVDTLFRFISLFFHYLAKVTGSDYVQMAATAMPVTFFSAQKLVGLNRDDFMKYVCCPKCSAIYEYEECISQTTGRDVPKHCSSCKFPRHPWQSMRGNCGSHLLKPVETSRLKIYKLIKTYCYKPISSSLVQILSRPGMIDLCKHWQNRSTYPAVLADIYDGNVWKEFESSGFFSQPYSYGLLLNIDWFEPFEHSVYATGVVFLALLNLPWHIRYSQENIIICGLIPGPKEPSLNANSFLEPLVQELLQLWKGKEVSLLSVKQNI